ncbi:hypothetical protein IWQ51_004143 [Labrenzia sp. EL_142]|nr:hypothetical protein [Labrenzia sp. EL_142]
MFFPGWVLELVRIEIVLSMAGFAALHACLFLSPAPNPDVLSASGTCTSTFVRGKGDLTGTN